jgi:uncharacterized membrane protein YeaQ/YmgE (transglycosylase-associated protein family)
MGLSGNTQLISLFLAVAIVGAMCGYLAATVARRRVAQRRQPRSRRVFLVGVFCGLVAGRIVPGRRRGRTVLMTFAGHAYRVRGNSGARRYGARALNSAARLLP